MEYCAQQYTPSVDQVVPPVLMQRRGRRRGKGRGEKGRGRRATSGAEEGE